MRNRLIRILFLLLGLLVLGACSSSGDSGDSQAKTLDYTSTSQNFIDALFSGALDDARRIIAEEYSDVVNEQIDQFAELLTKYEFREVSLSTIRAWKKGDGSEESDKTVEFTFQFRDQNPDAKWKTGSVNLRTLITEGDSWGIADLHLVRPKS